MQPQQNGTSSTPLRHKRIAKELPNFSNKNSEIQTCRYLLWYLHIWYLISDISSSAEGEFPCLFFWFLFLELTVNPVTPRPGKSISPCCGYMCSFAQRVTARWQRNEEVHTSRGEIYDCGAEHHNTEAAWFHFPLFPPPPIENRNIAYFEKEEATTTRIPWAAVSQLAFVESTTMATWDPWLVVSTVASEDCRPKQTSGCVVLLPLHWVSQLLCGPQVFANSRVWKCRGCVFLCVFLQNIFFLCWVFARVPLSITCITIYYNTTAERTFQVLAPFAGPPSTLSVPPYPPSLFCVYVCQFVCECVLKYCKWWAACLTSFSTPDDPTTRFSQPLVWVRRTNPPPNAFRHRPAFPSPREGRGTRGSQADRRRGRSSPFRGRWLVRWLSRSAGSNEKPHTNAIQSKSKARTIKLNNFVSFLLWIVVNETAGFAEV